MSDTDVTFRVSIDDYRNTDMAGIKHSFQSAGFAVDDDGKSGFMLTGPKALAENVFNSSIESKNGIQSFATDPQEKNILNKTSYRVYFPTKPQFF